MSPTAFHLTTERTALLPVRGADGEELLELFRDPAVRGFLLDGVVVTPEWMLEEIGLSQRRFARFGTGLWAVRLRGEPEIVGFAGFRESMDPPRPVLLYGFLPRCHGRGLAKEVTRELCRFVFEDLERDSIAALVDEPNRASVRVLERLGMSLEHTEPDGTLHYAVDRATWLRNTAREGHGGSGDRATAEG